MQHTQTNNYESLYTRVLGIFSQITRIPRASKHEDAIRRWLMEWSGEQSWKTAVDDFGNLFIYVPASPGMENSPTLVLQGHMDMVCEKHPESNHRFDTDPIPVMTNGEWMTADGTTLGADNGIAIAIALAVAESPTVKHPPLEICLTVEEETGLTGAVNLDAALLSGKILINLDSEDEGVITIGCAGGVDSDITLPIARRDRSTGDTDGELYLLQIGGLQGGHSGVEIGEIRGNALRLLGRALQEMSRNENSFQLIAVHGGNAHNAIPRDAAALLQITQGYQAAGTMLSGLQEKLRKEYQPVESGIEMSLLPWDQAPEHIRRTLEEAASRPAMQPESQRKVQCALLAYPHGVEKYSGSIEGLVETSCNLATIRTHADHIKLLCSQRSSVVSGLTGITDRIRAVTELLGADVKNPNSYPPWEPDFSSELLQHARRVYHERFGKDPVVETIHAGLECGIIGAKIPGMEMISIGPTIQFPHSPDEQLNLPSLKKTILFVTDLLESYAR
ncbi:MAG: beta-Ala-His dipeptidase [Spirochaeta sp.]